ncbi:hypothetical protein R1flu_024095 [Riccia fluitans]|uniref:Uncharacterized protein n=1 Tax=Riccia fluitans TaxID=41844 RepID=A0ABD1XXZ8_9MARC
MFRSRITLDHFDALSSRAFLYGAIGVCDVQPRHAASRMLRKRDSDGKSTDASGVNLVIQSATDDQNKESNKQPPKRNQFPKQVGAASKQSRAQPRSGSLNPFRCWASSRIQVEDEPPISVADQIAASVDSRSSAQPKEISNHVTEVTNFNPNWNSTSNKAPKEKGSGIPQNESSSSRKPAEIDSLPPSRDRRPSPTFEHEPAPRKISSAFEWRKHSQDVSNQRYASREKIVIGPSKAGTPPRASSRSRSSSSANRASPDSDGSKLAIPCTCHKDKAGPKGQSQKSKVEASMNKSSGLQGPSSRTEQGRGFSRDSEDDYAYRLDSPDPVGLRVLNLREFESISYSPATSRNGRSRSRSPPREGRSPSPRRPNKMAAGPPPRDGRCGGQRDELVLVSPRVIRSSRSPPRREPLALAPPCRDGRSGSPPRREQMGWEHKSCIVSSDQLVIKSRAKSAGRARGPWPDQSRSPERRNKYNYVDAEELEYWHEEKRGKEAAREIRANSRGGGNSRRTFAPIGNFYPLEGDIILRHRKRPNEPMIEFFHERSTLREHDHILRQNLQYDRRRDRLHCSSMLWRAIAVEVDNVRRDIRLHLQEAGCAEIDFDRLRTRRVADPGGKYVFERKFEAAGYSS